MTRVFFHFPAFASFASLSHGTGPSSRWREHPHHAEDVSASQKVRIGLGFRLV